MPDFENRELRYEDIDWGKTTLQRDVNYVPELRPEDIDTSQTPIAIPPPPPAIKRRVVRPKAAQKQSTFQFGPMLPPARKPSTFRGTPLSGRMRGEFDIQPFTEAERNALPPEQKLALVAAQDRISGQVTPSVRQSTPEDIAFAKKQEEHDLAVKNRLEGKTFFGINLPETPSFLDNDTVRELRQGFGHAHDVLTYQTPNVFLKGLAGVPEGAAEVAKFIGNKLTPKWVPLSNGPASPLMRRFTNKASDVIEEAFPTREEKNPLAVIAGSTAQFVIPGGALSKLGVSATATAGVFGAIMNVQQVAQEMDQVGVSPKRRDNAIAMAIASGLTEMVGLGAMIDKFGLHRTFVSQIIEIAEEGGQEAVQQYLNNLNAKLVGGWDPNRPLNKDVVQSAILGLGGGVLFAGINKAAIRDREKAILSSMGMKLKEDMTTYPMQVAGKEPVQQELPFEQTIVPPEKELSTDLLPPELQPVNVSPVMEGKKSKAKGEYHPQTEMPQLEDVEVKAPDITSFEVKEAKPRKTTPKKDSNVTKVGPPVPIDVIPVDDILGNKIDYTPEEKEAAKSKSTEALEAGLKGEPYPIPVPPPPTAAIIGPPGNRGVERTPDVNRVKDQLYKLNDQLKGLFVLAQEAHAAGDRQLLEAIGRRGDEISADIREHVNVIEQNGEDGETFQILPAETKGQAPTIIVPGWVISSLTGGDHMSTGGVAININDVNRAVANLYQFAPSPTAEMKAYKAIDELREQAESEGVNSLTFVHQWTSDTRRSQVIPHETFHAAQYTLAKITNAVNKYVDALTRSTTLDIPETLGAEEGPWHLHTHEWAKNNPVIRRVVDDPFFSDILKAPTVGVTDSVAVELPAYFAAGQGHIFGFTEDEQVEFLKDYVQHLYENHGLQVLDTFERVARMRPETANVFKEARNRYEVWKQDQLEQWNDSIKAFTSPIAAEFTGFEPGRFESSDPLEGILGPRKAGTKPPTDKTAARLAGKNYDQEAQQIREAMFQEREGWTSDPAWNGYESFVEGYYNGAIFPNIDGTFSASLSGRDLGNFDTAMDAKDAVQKAMDRRHLSKGGLERRGLDGLVNAIQQRFNEIDIEKGYNANPVPLTEEGWERELNNALWGSGEWVTDPIMMELRDFVREAYPERFAEVDEQRQKYKQDVANEGWEGKSKWELDYEEKDAIERIAGPDIRFTDVEFTEQDRKKLKKLNKVMEKAVREQGYATTAEGEKPTPGIPTVSEWLNENDYPFAVSKIKEAYPEEFKEWQELKDKEYQSKGGKRGARLQSIVPGDMPLDPRGGQKPRTESWIGGLDYEGGEGFELKTGGIGNMHRVLAYPENGEWTVKVDDKFVGNYPNELWAKAAGERALDKVDVSWQSVQRRNPELADLIKRGIMIADPSITVGSSFQFFERLTKVIKQMVNDEWSSQSAIGEYQSYVQEMFPEAAAEAKKSREMAAKREERYAQYRAEDEAVAREEEYKLREAEELHNMPDPRADMMRQIREEIAEEKKRRTKDEGSLTRLKMVIDPGRAQAGDRVRSEELNKYGSIASLSIGTNGTTVTINFDDGTTETRPLDDVHSAISPPKSMLKPTNTVVPKTEAQQQLAENPVVPSASENIEQMVLPGMERIMDLIKQNRPSDTKEFDKALNKLLDDKGIKSDPTRRPFMQVLEAMVTGKINAKEVSKLLEDNGSSMEQFMNEFKATALESDNSSRQLMRIKMRWLKQLKKNPDLANAMVFTPKELFTSVMEDINNTRLGLSAWQRLSGFIRMLMLSDINTAAVNALMTTGRIPLLAAVHGYSSWMKSMAEGGNKKLGQRMMDANRAALDAMSVAGNVLLTINPVDMIQNWRKSGTSRAEYHTAVYNELEKVFPDLEMRVKAPGIGLEGHATLTNQIEIAKDIIEQMRTKGSRVGSLSELGVAEKRLNSSLKWYGQIARGAEVSLELLLSPMRWQEWFFRKPVFISHLDLGLRRRGMDLGELIKTKQLETIPEDALKEAIDEALDFTYAYMPSEKGPGFEKSAFHIIKGINDMKGVAALVGTMFPRAVYNGMKFTYEYSPFGALPGIKKMLRPEYVTDPNTNERVHTNPLTQKDYDRFAKAQVGTLMFAAAMSLIKFGLVGDDWWQLRTPMKDKNGKPVYLDIRRYQPFAVFLKMADLTTRILSDAGVMQGKRGIGDLQFGKEIKEAITGMKSFPGAEEYVSATVDMWNDEDEASNVYQKAASSMGVSMSFITRPFINLRHAVAMFDEEEEKKRDVKGTGFLGPLADNVPWVRRKMLPEYQSMTEKPPVYNEAYPGLLFAGVRMIPAEGFAGREWRRLGFLNRRFLAPDPNPAINRKQNEVFQEIISSVGDDAENSPDYLNLDDKGKAAYWERLVDHVAPIARKIGETADPEEAMKRKVKRQLNMGPLQRKEAGLNNILDQR